MEKQCPVCNKVFITTNSQKKYCSESCRRKNWKKNNREKYLSANRRSWRKRQDKKIRGLTKDLICPNCGKKFSNTKSRNYSTIKFCSAKCRNLYNGRKQDKLKRKSEPPRKCVVCGKTFDPRKSFYYRTVQTCSKKCSKKLWREKHKNDKSYKKYKALRQRNRKHRIRANGGNLSNKEWESIKKRYNYKCAICGKKEPFDQSYKYLTQDHIKPISKGGKHNKDNIQPLCMECNIRKHNK